VNYRDRLIPSWPSVEWLESGVPIDQISEHNAEVLRRRYERFKSYETWPVAYDYSGVPPRQGVPA
jgi:hypothetical protein